MDGAGSSKKKQTLETVGNAQSSGSDDEEEADGDWDRSSAAEDEFEDDTIQIKRK